MTSIVASAFTPKEATAEGARIISQALQQPLGGAGHLALFAKDHTIPKAYLNYLFFDKEMKYKTGGFKQVTEDGLGKFEEMELEYAPEEEGYLMIYTANQTAEPLDVYFDQMTVTHTSSPIVRVDDYYPPAGGMTFNSSLLEGALTNKYLYNGKELQNELGLDWYDYGARMYDAAVGRFPSLDPISEKFAHVSPYNYAENRPIDGIDLWGLQYVSYRQLMQTSGLYSKSEINKFAGAHESGVLVGTSIVAGLTPLDAAVDAGELVADVAAGDVGGVILSVAAVVGLDFLKDGKKILSLTENAGPVAKISPSEVVNKTPDQIDDAAKRIGLEAKGPDPKSGQGSYVDPQTGQQRILSHPNAKNNDGSPNAHGHVNDADGNRINQQGDIVPNESQDAHLPIDINEEKLK